MGVQSPEPICFRPPDPALTHHSLWLTLSHPHSPYSRGVSVEVARVLFAAKSPKICIELTPLSVKGEAALSACD
jgi:hypothetical protein